MSFERVVSATVSDYDLHGNPGITPADLDGDGDYEYVIFTTAVEHSPATERGEDDLVALDSDGTTVLWRCDTGLGPHYVHHPWFHVYAGDTDGDGKDEVVHGLSDVGGGPESRAPYGEPEAGCLHLVDHDGSTVWRTEEYHGVETVCMGDVDGDGRPEIVAAWQEDAPDDLEGRHFGSDYGRYTVYDGDGTKRLDRRVGPTSPSERFGHHTGDETGAWIVYIAERNHPPFHAVRAADGSHRWTKDLGGDAGTSKFGVGDVDGDGESEIVVGTGTLRVYDSSGALEASLDGYDGADLGGYFGEIGQGAVSGVTDEYNLYAHATDGNTVAIYEYAGEET